MAVTFNGTALSSISFNETALSQVSFDGTVVFSGSQDEIIATNVTYGSGASVAPPPYNSEGYNVDTMPPEKKVMHTISLGDVTNYDKIIIDWDNQGSVNSYGEISAYAVVKGTRYNIFDDLDKSGHKEINIGSLTGATSLDIFTVAKSLSAYNGYISESVINLKNVVLHAGSVEPTPPVVSLTVDSGTSKVPPPYDENGYNYDGVAQGVTASDYITIDTTDKTTATVTWNKNGTNNDYGIIEAKYTIGGVDTTIFAENSLFDTHSELANPFTIPISSYTGSQTITFTASAESKSTYGGWSSKAVINIESVTLS